jgi:hypothetical protein
MSLITRCYRKEDEVELKIFMNKDGFVELSNDPKDSSMVSTIEYQKNNNNLGLCKSLILEDSETKKIVGHYGRLAMQFHESGKTITAVQSFGALIDKQYPGNLKKMLLEFHKKNDADIYLSVFPVDYICSSYPKTGYTEICKNFFKEQSYTFISLSDFAEETIAQVIIKKAVSVLLLPFSMFLFWRLKNKSKTATFIATIDNIIPENLSLIENTIAFRNKGKIYSIWNHSVLNDKYGNKIFSGNGKNMRENEVVVFSTKNALNETNGILILKKVRGLRRLIVSELQSIQNNQSEILNSLMSCAIAFCKKNSFNSIIFLGIEETYSAHLKKHFFHYTKVVDKKVFAYSEKHNVGNIHLTIADDDLNF